MLYVRFLIYLFLLFSIDMKANCANLTDLQNAFSQNKYNVICVTRDVIDHNIRTPQRLLPDNTINNIFQTILDEKESDTITFVVFNEYFFSRDTLNSETYDRIKSIILEQSKKMPNFIFYVNFLHDCENIAAETKEKLRIYSQFIEIEGDKFIWDVSHRDYQYDSNLVDQTDYFTPSFANETIAICNGVLLTSYKKSTYYNEDNSRLHNHCTYFFGFGKDEINPQLPLEYKQLAELLINNVYLDICWDIQRHVRYNIKRMFAYDFSRKADSISKQATKLKNVIVDPSNHKYKLHIIQSNTVQILDVLHEHDDNQVIIQSDPYISAVMKFLYPQKTSFLSKDMDFYTHIDIKKKSVASAIFNIKSTKETRKCIDNIDTNVPDKFIFSFFKIGG